MAANSTKTTVINLIKFLLFLSVGLVILYLVYRSQSNAYLAECALKGIPAEDCVLWRKVLADFQSANYGWLVVVIVCFCISNWSRAIRWNMLLRQLGHEPRWINAFLTINLGYFANLGLPRLGEVIRITTMAGYENIPVEKVAGTVVVDRIIDVISMLLVSALAVFLAYDQVWAWLNTSTNVVERISGAWPLLLAAALVGLIALGIAWSQRARIRSSRFGAKVEQLLLGFADGLRTVARLRRPGLFALHSVNIWLMYFLMTYLCFFSFQPTAGLSAEAGLVTFVFGGWGIVIPSPGGMGTYHFLVGSALDLYGLSGEDGFSFANIAFFTIQLGCNVTIGLLALLLLPLINRNTEKKNLGTDQ